MEKQGLLGDLGCPELAGRRPADTLLCNTVGVRTASRRQWPRVALDIGFVCPQALRHVAGAALESLATAKAYTAKKRDHNATDRRCEEVRIDYQPLVVETFGGAAEEAVDAIESLNQLVAVNTHTPHREVARRFWHRVSVDMQRSLHRAWARKTGIRRETGVDHVGRAMAAMWLLTPPGGGGP